MKKISFIFLAVFTALNLAGQAPQSFKYQAVARDASGGILANKPVSFKISILQNSAIGTAVYSELHAKTTNSFGLVDLEIGNGTSPTGNFSTINWGADKYFVKVEMDPAGGIAFQHFGTSQLLSVPYALYAKDVQNNNDADADPTNEIQALSISGTNLTLSKGGGTVTLPSAGGGDNWGTQVVQTDATLSGQGTTSLPLKIAQQSATNGQVLKWNGTSWIPSTDETGSGGSNPTGPAGGDLTGNYPNPVIADGKVTSAKILDGTITTADLADNAVNNAKIVDTAVSTNKLANNAVTAPKLASMGATLNQVLKWNGTAWGPAADNEGGLTLPYSGTGTSGSPLFNIVNLGTSGAISTLSSGNYGIWGESASTSGMGVYGVNKTTSGTTYGVFGDVYSSSGFSGFFQGGKFYVQGNTGIGTQNPSTKLEVNGQVKITGGNPGAGKVLTSDASGLASWGTPSVATHNHIGEVWDASVAWSGSAFKVMNSLNGPSIWGINSGGGNGIRGGAPGTGIGVYGEGDGGPGIKGISASGNGVEGNTLFGYSGYFTGPKFYVEGNTGIGIQNPSARLEVNGQVKITGGTPGAGKVLTSDASGLASWATPTSGPWLTSGNNVYYNTGYVGIGTNAPTYRLTIYDNTFSYIHFLNSSTGIDNNRGFVIGTTPSGNPAWIWNNEPTNIYFGTNNATRMIIAGDGHIDMMNFLNIGVTGSSALKVSNAQALWYNGDYFSWGYDGNWNYFADKVFIGPNVANPGTNMLVVNGDAAKPGGGSWLTWSDVRLKNIKGKFNKGLDEIIKLQPVNYSYKKGNKANLPDDKDYVGLIAQDVKKVFPEAITEGKDGLLQFDFNPVNNALINAIKELKAENDRLKAANSELEDRIEKIELLVGIQAEK